MNYFIYITGLASLMGFVLQIFNVFQKYKASRNAISFILFGVFIGSIISKFEPNTIKFDIAVNGYIILLALFITVILTTLVIGFLTNKKTRKTELFTVSTVAFVFFLIILFAGSITTSEQHELDMKKMETGNPNIEELIHIANLNENNHNLDRAIIHLEMIKTRLKRDDPRYGVIEERIRKLKIEQVE